MSALIATPKVKGLLDSLYEDAARSPRPQSGQQRQSEPMSERQRFHENRHAYMAIGAEFGRLLYTLVRASGARRIVEFGTSMGVSAIYLAAGLKDNGGGTLITTEYEPEKVERARKNLDAAGLVDLVDFRVGDALESLRTEMPETVDMLFLDGAKSMYLDVLRLVEPRLHTGAIVASDNTDHDAVKPMLDYLRDPANGYVSCGIVTARGNGQGGQEISLKV